MAFSLPSLTIASLLAHGFRPSWNDRRRPKTRGAHSYMALQGAKEDPMTPEIDVLLVSSLHVARDAADPSVYRPIRLAIVMELRDDVQTERLR